MTEQHPITPSPELMEAWSREVNYNEPTFAQVAIKAARWGADQELEACCEWLEERIGGIYHRELRAARRPKPPNKKQRGLTALEATNLKKDDPLLYQEILNAIEGLPDD